jgi:TonB-dependent SusC/RagA subfamily outer membrane receptor
MIRVLVILSAVILSACSMTGFNASNHDAARIKTSKMNAITEVNTPYPTLTLMDYLKRVPGIQVINTGNKPEVRIRHGISIVGEQEPLYVIDDVRIGNDYSTAEAYVDVNDISSISVLKDVSSTNLYGFQGANGVIIIHTKK